MLRFILIAWLSFCGAANAQLAGGLQFPGPGMPAASAAAFVGVGDVVATWAAWGSCARVFTAAQATTSTSLCDLVDTSSRAAVICTLRGSSTGFVDLAGSYCTGGLTPAAKCAAATGGVCAVAKVYDQTGNSRDWTRADGNQPTLTFSAVGGLPGLTCTNAAASQMNSPSFTIAQPYSVSVVAKRTGSTGTITSILGENSGGSINFGYAASVNTANLSSPTALTATASDSAFHAMQGVANSASSELVVDGASTSGNSGTTGITVGVRICRSSAGNSIDGQVMEVGVWSGALNATQYGNINTNQHSAANGYNF